MPLASTLSTWLRKDDRVSLRQHVKAVLETEKFKRESRRFPFMIYSDGNVAAYVANFSRPQNIEAIVRSLLAVPAVGTIVISNNNPDCDLRSWLPPLPSRVVILEHAKPQACAMRYRHLEAFPAQNYLVLDDDLFLTPVQIAKILTSLNQEWRVPHGIFGGHYGGSHVRGDTRADTIHRVYAFTGKHLAEFIRLGELAKRNGFPEFWNSSYFDDLTISFSGDEQCRIHDVGPYPDCPTSGHVGTAVFREEDFNKRRNEYIQLMRELKQRV